MLRRLFHSRLLLAASITALAVTPAARALEHVTLRNGFTYDCARRQPLADGRVRLFLDASDAANYIDLPAAEIQSVVTLPDPPPTAARAASAASSADIHSLLAHAGDQHDIDIDLLASIVHAESNGHRHAVSRTGAQGLMQLMPETAHSLGVHDSFQPDQNIDGGTAYLDALLTRYNNNLALALAAYNAGPAAVDRYHGIPPYRETRAYVARVMKEFKRRKLQLAHQQNTQLAQSSPAAH
ncbi:MAG TPA: lytic transglycosylase domain-containing protein [Acidobacteriaceae bacterium]|nr:lytic transglycosylase domain-containing protein [Acidobacteriaceae bacterium]